MTVWGVWGGLGLGFSQYVNRCRVSLCLAVCGAGALRCCVACAGVACTLTPPSIERYGRPWPWPMLVSCVCVARQRRNFFRCVDHEGGQYSARTLIIRTARGGPLSGKIARPPRWICPSRGPTSRRDRSGLRSGLGPRHCRVSCHEVRELQPLASPPPPCVPRAAREKGEGGGVRAPAASGLPWPSRADDASRNRREREVMSSAVSGLGKQRSKP